MAKIYLAHNWAARDYLRDIVAPVIEAMGHEVTSHWFRDEEWAMKGNAVEAKTDLQDILHADIVVLFVDQYGETPGQGKYVELGYAMALGNRVILCGQDNRCVFYSLIPEKVEGELELMMMLAKELLDAAD